MVSDSSSCPKRATLLSSRAEKRCLSLRTIFSMQSVSTARQPPSRKAIIESLQLSFRHIILFIRYGRDRTQGGWTANGSPVRLYMYLPWVFLSRHQKRERHIRFFALGHTEKNWEGCCQPCSPSIYTWPLWYVQCEIDYDNPPWRFNVRCSSEWCTTGTQGNLFCITGGEGTGKSNYVAAILTGTLGTERLPAEGHWDWKLRPTLTAWRYYTTTREQSEAQLHKNLGKTYNVLHWKLYRSFTHSLYPPRSRKDRLKLIRESMDLFHRKHGGIHLWWLMVLPTWYVPPMMKRKALPSLMSFIAWAGL